MTIAYQQFCRTKPLKTLRKSQRVTDSPVGDCSPAYCADAPPDPLSRTVSSVRRPLVLNSVTWARRKLRHRRRVWGLSRPERQQDAALQKRTSWILQQSASVRIWLRMS